MKRILFVCHGNICRSPMAEFVMKYLVNEAGLSDKIFVSSAACRTDAIGSDTYRGTKEVLKMKGIPFTPRQAVQITADDYDRFDLIIAMDSENIRDLNRLTHGDPQKKIHLLLENRDVADPWYTDDFETTYRDVLNGCESLLKKLM